MYWHLMSDNCFQLVLYIYCILSCIFTVNSRLEKNGREKGRGKAELITSDLHSVWSNQWTNAIRLTRLKCLWLLTSPVISSGTNKPHHSLWIQCKLRVLMWFPWICLLFFENRPGSKTFGSMMIRDDIMGPLQQTNKAMCCHYSVGRG